MRRLLAVLLLIVARAAFAADYEILEISSNIVIESSAFVSEHHREVVRILTDEGKSYRKYLAVNSYIQVRNISASVQQPGGRIERMKSEDFVEVPISHSDTMITDLKAIVIAPQGVIRGSIVTIEYDRTATSLLYIEPWTYATAVPVRKASCVLKHPATLTIKYRGHDDQVKIQDSTDAGTRTLRLEAENRSAVVVLGDHDSSGSVEKEVDFVPDKCRIDKWNLSTESWESVAQWFTELSRFAYQWDPGMDAVVEEVKKNASTPEEIAEAIYKYIQEKFIYTAIEVGIGGYKPRFTSMTFQKKYGDCKDLTFLYVLLLQKAGIQALPALVDTRSAKFFRQDFPTPTQFNHCITYLPGIRGGTWVDNTVKNFRLGEVPSIIQGHQALIIGPNKLMQIPERLQDSNKLNVSIKGGLDESSATMEGTIATSGSVSMLVDVMRNVLVQNAVRNYVFDTILLADMPLQSLETKVVAERELSLRFHTPLYASGSYRMLLMNPVNYSALEHLAFAPRSGRYYATGSPLRLSAECKVDLSGKRLISEPYSKSARGEFVHYTLELSEKDGQLFSSQTCTSQTDCWTMSNSLATKKSSANSPPSSNAPSSFSNCRWKGRCWLL